MLANERRSPQTAGSRQAWPVASRWALAATVKQKFEPRPRKPVAPPRLIAHPSSRLLADDTHPSARYRGMVGSEAEDKTIFSFQAPLRLPRPSYRAEDLTNDDEKAGFMHVNGTLKLSHSRKRLAEDTELDLVAANNGVYDNKSTLITAREGAVEPDSGSFTDPPSDSPPEEITTTPPPAASLLNPPQMFQKLTSAVSSFSATMINNIRSVISSFGQQFDRLANREFYDIAEIRTFIDEGKFISIKRQKVAPKPLFQNRRELYQAAHETEQEEPISENQLRWVTDSEIKVVQRAFFKFSEFFHHLWHATDAYHSPEAINKALAPLHNALIDNVDDYQALFNGHDLREIFGLHIEKNLKLLENVYNVGTIARIRQRHAYVPAKIDYEMGEDQQKTFYRIKALLSAPAFYTVCRDLLDLGSKTYVRISEKLVENVILDMHAVLNGLPLPSYVGSNAYAERLKTYYPPPKRTDLSYHLLMPGAFPNEVPEPISESGADAQVPPQPSPQASLQASAKASPQPQSPDSVSPSPIIHRHKFRQPDFLRAQITGTSIVRITPEQYNTVFCGESISEACRSIKDAYITDFKPKSPLPSVAAKSIRSILKSTNKHKHPSRRTPKRLRITRPPKAVRFTESTLDPRPRTHTGLDIPKLDEPQYDDETPKPHTQMSHETGVQALEEISSLFICDEAEPKTEDDDDRIIKSSWLRRHLSDEERTPVQVDPTKAIEELLAMPSVSLRISDDTRARIETRKEEAALKAAEDARLAEEAARRAAEEQARRELEARLARSGGLRMPSQPFMTPLSQDWQLRAHNTLRAAATTTLATTGEGIDLRRHDFAKVVPATEWLNDEIVNGSLNWLDRAINSAAGIKDVKRNTRKCWTMSSFFFKRLREQGVTNTQRTLRRHGVEKNNFLDIETILLPICERSHWTILVIRPQKRTIAHMDSLNPRGCAEYTRVAEAWIKDVLGDAFKEDEWRVLSHEAPLQTNGHDCGVHTITNAICLALGLSPIDCYTAYDMPQQRLRIACMLLNGGFNGEFDLRVY